MRSDQIRSDEMSDMNAPLFVHESILVLCESRVGPSSGFVLVDGQLALSCELFDCIMHSASHHHHCLLGDVGRLFISVNLCNLCMIIVWSSS